MPNSAAWVYTVYSGMSFPIHRVNTVDIVPTPCRKCIVELILEEKPEFFLSGNPSSLIQKGATCMGYCIKKKERKKKDAIRPQEVGHGHKMIPYCLITC